jgi:hypothetical protein
VVGVERLVEQQLALRADEGSGGKVAAIGEATSPPGAEFRRDLVEASFLDLLGVVLPQRKGMATRQFRRRAGVDGAVPGLHFGAFTAGRDQFAAQGVGPGVEAQVQGQRRQAGAGGQGDFRLQAAVGGFAEGSEDGTQPPAVGSRGTEFEVGEAVAVDVTRRHGAAAGEQVAGTGAVNRQVGTAGAEVELGGVAVFAKNNAGLTGDGSHFARAVATRGTADQILAAIPIEIGQQQRAALAELVAGGGIEHTQVRGRSGRAGSVERAAEIRPAEPDLHNTRIGSHRVANIGHGRGNDEIGEAVAIEVAVAHDPPQPSLASRPLARLLTALPAEPGARASSQVDSKAEPKTGRNKPEQSSRPGLLSNL